MIRMTLICIITSFMHGSELTPWIKNGSTGKQSASGVTGMIFNEAIEVKDGSGITVHQKIWHKKYGDNVMDESEDGKSLVVEIYSIKGSGRYYYLSMLATIPGYSMIIENVDKNPNGAMNSIGLYLPLMQKPSIQLLFANDRFNLVKTNE